MLCVTQKKDKERGKILSIDFPFWIVVYAKDKQFPYLVCKIKDVGEAEFVGGD